MKTLIIIACLLAVALSFPEKPHQSYSSNRIYGGQNATEGEFPFMVSVRYWEPGWGDHAHICGGSILSRTHILTAGHCVRGKSSSGSSYFYIWAGITDLDKNDGINVQKIKVEKLFLHESYPTKGVGPYDVGILILALPLLLDDFVTPIALPTIANENPASSLKLIGWGEQRPWKFSKVLQKVDKRIEQLPECQANLAEILETPKTGLDEREHGSNICTSGGTRENPLAACSGDSGSPLFEIRDGKPVQVGIVSWGISPCPEPNAPTVYTKVSHVLDWINEKLKEEAPQKKCPRKKGHRCSKF